MAKKNLKDYSLEELEEELKKRGYKSYRSKQIYEWIFKRKVSSFSQMTNIPKDLKDDLEKEFSLDSLVLLKQKISKDNSAVKYLWGLKDAQSIETVLMEYDYGCSVCVSSQVGCSMGCVFCASAQGQIRNLSCGELCEQVIKAKTLSNKKVNHIVLMGTGEPLVNFKEVLKFIGQITNPLGFGLSVRNISLSTCGLVPQIESLGKERLPLTLAISLHAPNDELRDKLMPINKKYPLSSLMEACENYANSTKRRITYEYILLKGVNDSLSCARQLAFLLRGRLCHVNLISYNEVLGKSFKPSPAEQITKFKKVLEEHNIPTTLRRKLGFDIEAACGQLKRSCFQDKSI